MESREVIKTSHLQSSHSWPPQTWSGIGFTVVEMGKVHDLRQGITACGSFFQFV